MIVNAPVFEAMFYLDVWQVERLMPLKMWHIKDRHKYFRMESMKKCKLKWKESVI